MAKQHRKGTTGQKDVNAKSERRCIVHRQVRSKDQMIRFVLDPEGSVVADLKSILPGRGVWVTARREDVDFAVKNRLFSRGFKKEAKADGELGEQVTMLLRAQALQAVSLANKAGSVTTGFDKVADALKGKQTAAVLFASDGAEDGVRKIRHKIGDRTETGSVFVYQKFNSEELGLALGRANVVHAALKESGATRNCLKAIRRLDHFVDGPADETTAT